jgi:ribosomal protein L40E
MRHPWLSPTRAMPAGLAMRGQRRGSAPGRRRVSLLVHLICLRCNRANAPDSKFCSECGAGLLRKFCNECHAVNDAESHFCQSCGATLSAPPFVPPAPSATPPGEDSGLIDVAYREPDERRHLVSTPVQFDSEPIVAVPPQMATLPAGTAPWVGKAPISAYRMPILLGLGSVAMTLLATLLWPRSESPSEPSDAAPARGPSSISASQGTTGVTAMPALSEAAVPLARPASASSDVPRHEAAVAPLPPLSGGFAQEPDKTQTRRAPVDWILAAHPPASGAAKKPTPAVERLRAPLTQPRPRPATPPECTPQVDALGLCEPGANVTGR